MTGVKIPDHAEFDCQKIKDMLGKVISSEWNTLTRETLAERADVEMSTINKMLGGGAGNITMTKPSCQAVIGALLVNWKIPIRDILTDDCLNDPELSNWSLSTRQVSGALQVCEAHPGFQFVDSYSTSSIDAYLEVFTQQIQTAEHGVWMAGSGMDLDEKELKNSWAYPFLRSLAATALHAPVHRIELSAKHPLRKPWIKRVAQCLANMDDVHLYVPDSEGPDVWPGIRDLAVLDPESVDNRLVQIKLANPVPGFNSEASLIYAMCCADADLVERTTKHLKSRMECCREVTGAELLTYYDFPPDEIAQILDEETCEMVHFFTYGRDMSTGVLTQRAPSSRTPRPATLHDHFATYAVNTPAYGGSSLGAIPRHKIGKPPKGCEAGIRGVVWEVSRFDLETRLDFYNVAATKETGKLGTLEFFRKEVEVELEGGETLKAFAYIADGDRHETLPVGEPNENYVAQVRKAAAEHELGEISYLYRDQPLDEA